MMRKVFVGLLVGAVAVGLAAPAFAADLKFSGAYRLRGQVDQGSPCFNANPPNVECDGHQIQARFRPKFEVETEGGVKGVIFLEIGDLRFGETATVAKGATGGAGNDGVNIETKWAYIDFPIPGTATRLRGGLQGFNTNKDLLLADDGPGFTLYGKLGEADWKAWWMRANEAVIAIGSEGTRAKDLYALDISLSPVKDLNLNGYFIYSHDGEGPVGTPSASATGTWLGLGAAGKVQNIRWDADFVYGSKEIAGVVAGTKADQSGYVVDLGVGMALPGTALDLEVRAWYASGDKRDGGDNEGFPVLAATGLTSPTPDHNTGAQIWGNGGAVDIDELADSPENTFGIGLIARYTVSPTLKLSGNLHYIGVNEEGSLATGGSPVGNGGISGVESIGTEAGVRVDYTLHKGLVLTVLLSHLFLGDDTGITTGGSAVRFDDITKFAAVLNYGF
jgi:hypothetical protein